MEWWFMILITAGVVMLILAGDVSRLFSKWIWPGWAPVARFSYIDLKRWADHVPLYMIGLIVIVLTGTYLLFFYVYSGWIHPEFNPFSPHNWGVYKNIISYSFSFIHLWVIPLLLSFALLGLVKFSLQTQNLMVFYGALIVIGETVLVNLWLTPFSHWLTSTGFLLIGVVGKLLLGYGLIITNDGPNPFGTILGWILVLDGSSELISPITDRIVFWTVSPDRLAEIPALARWIFRIDDVVTLLSYAALIPFYWLLWLHDETS